jgi:hypothetical protein
MKKMTWLGIVALVVALPLTAFAGVYNSDGILGRIQYFDFSAQGSHNNWDTDASGRKFATLELAGSGSGSCFLVSISPVSGTAGNTDIIALTDNDTVIDDDGPSGSLLPFFKVWTSTTRFIKLRAYSTGHNSDDWQMQLTQSVRSKASCASSDVGGSASIPLYDGNTSTVSPGPTVLN